ncbi:dihydropteroate synthase [Pantoea ananatis]
MTCALCPNQERWPPPPPTGLPVYRIHMKGEPRTMQQAPAYQDIVSEVDTYFVEQLAVCGRTGIKKRICCSTGLLVSVRISTHSMNCWLDSANFTIFGLPLLVGMSENQ